MKAVRANNAVKRIVKNPFIWLFYNFCSEYARQPVDLDDLLDGLLCIRAKSEVEKIMAEE